jgi:hypothetical protein
MKSQTSIFRQIVGSLILFSIASLFFFCTAGPLMTMGDMNQVSDCGMSHNVALCPMVLMGRLEFWQMITLPAFSSFSALTLLVFLATLAFFWSSSSVLQLMQFKLRRVSDVNILILFDYLQQQFSQGILRTKIY